MHLIYREILNIRIPPASKDLCSKIPEKSNPLCGIKPDILWSCCSFIPILLLFAAILLASYAILHTIVPILLVFCAILLSVMPRLIFKLDRIRYCPILHNKTEIEIQTIARFRPNQMLFHNSIRFRQSTKISPEYFYCTGIHKCRTII